MIVLPHDIPDLYFAPVVLDLNARIDELSRLSPDALSERVALVSDMADWTPALRDAALLRTVQHDIDCHDWDLSWDERGVRVRHGAHQAVLGVPATFVSFLAGQTSAMA
jgi:hypothetical protein